MKGWSKSKATSLGNRPETIFGDRKLHKGKKPQSTTMHADWADLMGNKTKKIDRKNESLTIPNCENSPYTLHHLVRKSTNI